MRYGNNKANIIVRPYTVTLTYGDIENNHHSMLDPLHVCDAMEAAKGVFEMGFQVHEGWPLDHHFSHVIAQWRQINNPTHALRIDGDRWLYHGILGQHDLGQVTLERTDFTFDFLWRDNDEGRMKVIRDNETVLESRGPTIDTEKRDHMHWATGIYRPWWNSHELQDNEPSYRTIEIWL